MKKRLKTKKFDSWIQLIKFIQFNINNIDIKSIHKVPNWNWVIRYYSNSPLLTEKENEELYS